MDLVLEGASLPGVAEPCDIAVADGRIAALARRIEADAPRVALDGRLVCGGFVETHIHLDKSCLSDRCRPGGSLADAIAEVSRLKADFIAEDVYTRGRRTLEKAIGHGTTRMRTHLEVDPTVGLRSLDGIRQLASDYAWAIDIEICAFPQEGLTNVPGGEDVLRQALREGAHLVGGAPYVDPDPIGQIDRIFALAREFAVDVDLHLDFDLVPDGATLFAVCERTERYGLGGRVAIGHVSKLSVMAPDAVETAARRLADAGVALTVLPATDLFLMGRDRDHAVPRGLAPAHRLRDAGVTCSLATNNVLNPFTPYGDASLVRMANLAANVLQVGTPDGLGACFDMVTAGAARLMGLRNYGVAVGHPADLVVLDCTDTAAAVAELAPVLHAFKAGRKTVTRAPATLHPPA